MTPLEDIFSKTSTKKEEPCPNPKCKIIIDTREKQSLIAANLFNQKANLEFQTLEIGDYLIGETIIERKTFSDFISSMISKRLQEQLINLRKYDKKFLILEGFGYNYEKFKIHKNAIKGMLISVATDFQIPIIYTADTSDTASFLILTAKKYEKNPQEISVRQSRNIKNLEEQKQFILEGFPGIGPKTAKELISNFGSLKNIFNSTNEEISNLKILDENKLKKFKNILED